ncbi:phenylacetate--CoA ligase family protein [Novosphingobium sp.]|uniref:phenylacetate--CoA ligase family protein n=1 Tax=Novosphingobium sp. TaxID=1874826 RepID=UPI003B52DB95
MPKPTPAPLLQPKLKLPAPATVIDLDRQIAAAERLPPTQIHTRQLAQVARLAQHFANQSPRFAERLRAARLTPADLARKTGFTALLPMDRRWLQQSQGLFAATLPPGHEPRGTNSTSGSTGEPVTVQRSHVMQLIWLANIAREHRWRGSDFAMPLASIRAHIDAPRALPGWGPPADFLATTGPSVSLPITWDAEQLYEYLRDYRPGNLLIYPTTLTALIDIAAARGPFLPAGAMIRTIGETVTPHLRGRCQTVLGTSIQDTYSSQEIGHIAIQCPDYQTYHTAAESVLVEVLHPDGTPCQPGETGAVVITDLANTATPLIRYKIGDHAEMGSPCPCGRTSPTLRKIMGRERNMIVKPDGTRHWPLVGFDRFRDLAPVRQYQLIQHDPDQIEARFATTRPVTPTEETALRAHLHTALGHPFTLTLRYYTEDLPGSRTGKFEEFLRLF